MPERRRENYPRIAIKIREAINATNAVNLLHPAYAVRSRRARRRLTAPGKNNTPLFPGCGTPVRRPRIGEAGSTPPRRVRRRCPPPWPPSKSRVQSRHRPPYESGTPRPRRSLLSPLSALGAASRSQCRPPKLARDRYGPLCLNQIFRHFGRA
jgi:hypothetical protein